jgi:hypothetical protein
MNEQDERPSHGNPIREAETAEEDQFTAKIRFTNRGRSAILPVIEVGFLCLFRQFVLNNRFGTWQPSRASQRGLIFCRFLCKRLTCLEVIPSKAQMAGDTVMRHFVSP